MNGVAAGRSSSSPSADDAATANTASESVKVVVHDSAGPADVKTAASAAAAAAAAAAVGYKGGASEAEDDPLMLAAPAELPPGEFTCVVEAMVLQVRG
jgi:hypothetical protein